MKNTNEIKTLLIGLGFGESPRWHDGRLWFANWKVEEVVAADMQGNSEVIVRMPSFPFSIDWLPDGRLLIISGRERLLQRMEADGTLTTHADLTGLTPDSCNEIVVDGRGNIYVNAGGFGPIAKGIIIHIAPDGTARQVADGIAFPNGMAITPDSSTLIIADSWGKKLTAFNIEADGSLSNSRTWASLGDGCPDGICIDTEGAVRGQKYRVGCHAEALEACGQRSLRHTSTLTHSSLCPTHKLRVLQQDTPF